MSTNADGNSPQVEELEVQEAPAQEPKPKDSKPEPKAKTQASKDTTKPAEQPKGRSPWEDDLYGRGLDDPKFHDYMREVQQPYITKMEQQLSQYRNAFGEDPEALEVAAQIFGQLAADPDEHPGVAGDAIRKLVEVLELDPDELFPYEDGGGDDPNAPIDFTEDDGSDPGTDPAEEDPRLKWASDKMTEEQEAREAEWYNGVVAKLKEGIPGFNEKLWHKMVLAAQGDLEQALDMYEEHHTTPDPKPPAPPTHGSAGSMAPAESKRYDSFDDAINDFVDELRTSRR